MEGMLTYLRERSAEDGHVLGRFSARRATATSPGSLYWADCTVCGGRVYYATRTNGVFGWAWRQPCPGKMEGDSNAARA